MGRGGDTSVPLQKLTDNFRVGFPKWVPEMEPVRSCHEACSLTATVAKKMPGQCLQAYFKLASAATLIYEIYSAVYNEAWAVR